jgi:hypothetical protein
MYKMYTLKIKRCGNCLCDPKNKEKSHQNIEAYHNKSEFSGLVLILFFSIWTALPIVSYG